MRNSRTCEKGDILFKEINIHFYKFNNIKILVFIYTLMKQMAINKIIS